MANLKRDRKPGRVPTSPQPGSLTPLNGRQYPTLARRNINGFQSVSSGQAATASGHVPMPPSPLGDPNGAGRRGACKANVAFSNQIATSSSRLRSPNQVHDWQQCAASPVTFSGNVTVPTSRFILILMAAGGRPRWTFPSGKPEFSGLGGEDGPQGREGPSWNPGPDAYSGTTTITGGTPAIPLATAVIFQPPRRYRSAEAPSA